VPSLLWQFNWKTAAESQLIRSKLPRFKWPSTNSIQSQNGPFWNKQKCKVSPADFTYFNLNHLKNGRLLHAFPSLGFKTKDEKIEFDLQFIFGCDRPSERQMRKADARCRRDVLRTRQPLTIRNAAHVFNGRRKIFNVKMLLPNLSQFHSNRFIFFLKINFKVVALLMNIYIRPSFFMSR
jgi:hypothetical protein